MGQILDAKYDVPLRNRLIAGVGENEILDVIVLLDPQNPQTSIAREAIQSAGGEVKYEYHVFQGILTAIPAKNLKMIAGCAAVLRICDDYVTSIPQGMSPATALADTTNWWRGVVSADDISQTGKDVKVAILDTGLGYVTTGGINGYHTDFPYSRIFAFKNFAKEDDVVVSTEIYDGHGHGTHTAGIALGSGAASSGKYQGIAPDAKLLVGKVLNSSGSGESSDIIKGIEWAVDNGAQVISMSLGGGFPEVFTPDALAIQNATEHGALVVASAGNGGPYYFSGGVPGSSLYTLSVAASDRNNNVADFSSLGPTWSMQAYPCITAPGVDIIAPLGLQSIIEKEEVYVENIIPGTSGSDYVPLSGTSMSAPIVAGAAALLLEAYPTTNPTTLRIALMESASDLGVASVRQGSGLLNVYTARSYLQTLSTKPSSTDINNITRVYPKELPFEPYDLLKFPGDAQTMNLTVISGIKRNISIEMPAIPGVQLTTSQSVLNFTNAGVKLWNLTVSVDWNTSVGVKSGVIKFIDTTTGETLDQVSLNLTISLPKRRVYFDGFHGLNDYFNAGPYATPQYALYNLAKAFTAKNYSVDLKMEFWTPGYDPDLDGRLLTYDLLQNYDTVVLQTPSLPYTPTEIQALVDFRARNGSILVIGDRHQSLTVDSVNNLLSRLGTGISYLPTNLESTQFLGISYSRNILVISPELPTDPMLTGVQTLLFDGGAILQTSGTATSIVNVTVLGLPISLAAKSTGTGAAGNIVVLSGPSFLSDYYMTFPEYGGNQTRFASNLIDYLLPAQTFNIARKITPERSSGGIIETYLYVTNGSTGVPITGLSSGTTLNLTCSNSTGFVQVMTLNEESGVGVEGIYRNASYTLQNPSLSPYFLNASAIVNGMHRNVTGAAIRTSSNSPQFITNWQDADVMDRSAGANGVMEISLLTSGSLSDVKVYAGSTPYNKDYPGLSLFNEREQYSFNQSLLVGPPYHLSIDVRGHTSGLYYYFYEANNTDGYTNAYSNRDPFTVINYDPYIDEANSYFGQYVFNQMKSDEGYFIQQTQQLQTYSFQVTASDIEDLEDHNILTGVVAFSPAYTLNNSIGLISNIRDLPFTYLEHSNTGILEGQLQIPESLNASKGDGTEIVKSTASSGDYLAIFEVVVMDTDGGFADYIIIMEVAPSLNLLLIILVIVAIAASVGVTAFILYRRHRASMLGHGPQPRDQYERVYEIPVSNEMKFEIEDQRAHPSGSLRKFCPYCGQPISMDATQCPNCGANIPSTDFY